MKKLALLVLLLTGCASEEEVVALTQSRTRSDNVDSVAVVAGSVVYRIRLEGATCYAQVYWTSSYAGGFDCVP